MHKRALLRISCVLLACLGSLAIPQTAHADHAPGGPLGLGLILGRPTGLTAEYRLSGDNSLDFAIGIDPIDDGHFYVHGDYLFYFSNLVGSGSVSLMPYLGPGVFIGGGDVFFGARFPFGLSLDFQTAPVKIFLEIAPHLLIVPDVDLDIGGALGFRYFF